MLIAITRDVGLALAVKAQRYMARQRIVRRVRPNA